MSEYYVPRDVLGFSEDLYSLFLSEQPAKSYEAGQDCLYWFNFKFVSREATIPVKNDDPIKIIGWFPVDWSEMAAKIVAGKYFRTYPNGKQENSVITMVMRVVGTITQWVSDNEQISIKEAFDSVGRPLINMILSQRATFNSPVWFNLGYQNRKQQASACYILEIEDNMESILNWYKEAGMIFKGGSGAGINISPLREKGAPLSTGGETSGPLSFMATADQNAAAIKSAGASRRAASIIVMDDWHPDIEEFINCKLVEEQKAHALIEAGYSPNFDDENGAYHSVKYQNANHTVRLSDQFMNAVDADQDWQFSNGKVKKARDIANQIANAAHACGDPGVQFIDTIEHWNTYADTEYITSTNPCSEFCSINNTSCNLASLNVVKYELDSQKIESDVRTLVRAMDAIVSFAYYPTEKITEKTKRFRPLGIGISNLGSYFMRELIPYDSYEARSIASSIMAFITAVGYDESSKLARKIGPFSEYKYNKGSMNRVIRQHHEAAAELDESLGIAAYEIFSKLVENSKDENFGYRNAQMSLVAPAGTISFMMDCETTGLEPALSLTYYKQFVGGEVEKNISKTAKTAIINYGKTRNNSELSEEIIKRIENDQAFEDIASNKLLDILDCALPYPAHDSNRCISADAHIKMLAAIQPFISGASSKTVNMPATATPEDVWKVYRDAWKAGIKCVALYVDGSKGSQPIYTSKSKKDDPEKPETVVVRNGRVRLPDERHSLTHKFNIGQHEGYVTVGFYPDGKPGEIFITMSKEGSTISGLMDTIATITSISLQHGIPIESLCKKFRDVRFEPSGITGNPDIRFAHSIVDYIFRWLELKVANNGIEDYHVEHSERLPDKESVQTGDICPECGMSTMVRTGSCMTCTTCGTNTGCG